MRRWRIPKYYPGWFVSGGGGGGLSTVNTDGSLTGAGTVASPLKVTAATGFCLISQTNNTDTVTANTMLLYGFLLPCPVIINKLWINIQVADNANNNDVGLYNQTGTLLAHIGAQHLASTGQQGIAATGAPITAPQGVVFLAVTSAASTLAINGNNSYLVLYHNTSFGSSAGGTLPATITPPTLSPTGWMPMFAIT